MADQTPVQDQKVEKAPSVQEKDAVVVAPEAQQKEEPTTTTAPEATPSAPADTTAPTETPESKPEPPATTEAKAEQPETKPEEPAVSEPKAETQPEPEAETKPETKAEPQSEITAAAAAGTEQPAEAAVPETEKEKDNKPEYLTKTPALGQFFDDLPAILTKTEHHEMWGVTLKDSTDIPTVNVLIKFLRANEGDLKLAKEQLTKALEWRKQMDPLALVEASYSAEKFGGLGFLTTYPREDKRDLIVTWNIYGAVKKIDETFGDVDEFVKWRAALMELAVKELKLDEATSVIDYDGEDPYQMIQVHDYLNVSFLRLNPSIRAATKKTIEVFSTAYPELLREKFFVNVPAIMGWMFAAMKLFVSQNTTRKFHPISNGANLAREFPGLVEEFPKAYGGGAKELEGSARTVKLDA